METAVEFLGKEKKKTEKGVAVDKMKKKGLFRRAYIVLLCFVLIQGGFFWFHILNQPGFALLYKGSKILETTKESRPLAHVPVRPIPPPLTTPAPALP